MFDALETELAPDDCRIAVPTSQLTVHCVRIIIQDRATPDPICDSLWAALIRRAQTERCPGEKNLIWIMLPRLRGIANRLYRTWQIDIQDIRSEVITAFIETGRHADPEQPSLGKRLWWSTYSLARQACWQATRDVVHEDVESLMIRRHGTSEPTFSSTPYEGTRDRAAVEGERLGALASRLGLRKVINDGHNSTEPRTAA
ncbi:hypothetical protein AB5J62_37550 [Amycolatopsis sp. cg5]|uniref:hypothetical protein n=1 Tax=Amycolatopsis sp. cg5 TaxID=3238802 RepID=UPI003523E93B